MRSAFGVEHCGFSKRLPSALRAGAKLKPLGTGAEKLAAHQAGREASRQKALMRTKKPGWTTHQFLHGTAIQEGRNAKAAGQVKMGRLKDLQVKRKVLI